jgi:hypothetical protein
MYGEEINLNPNLKGVTVTSLGGARRNADQRFDYFKNGGCVETRPVNIKAGQVLKARTWLQRGTDNTYEAYGSFEESYALTISGSMVAGETATIAGITLTANSALTHDKVATAFAVYSDLQVNGKIANVGTNPDTAVGTWTGTWTGLWHFAVDVSSILDATANTVLLISSTSPASLVTALAAPSETSGLTFSTALKSVPGETSIYFSGTGLLNTHAITIGGVTATAGATLSPAAMVAAFAALGSASTATVTSITFSGTNGGYTFSSDTNANVLRVVPNTSNTTMVPVNIASTAATGAEMQVTLAPTAQRQVAGMLAIDVNATAGTTLSEMYVELSAWYEGCLWKYTPGVPSITLPAGVTDNFDGVDYVVNGDGTVTQCSPYYTGVSNYLDALAFIENTAGGTEFSLASWDLTLGEKRDVR